MNYFLVIKRIGKKKKPYYYRQRVWKENGRTRTHSIYVGPVDKIGNNIYTKFNYGTTNSTDKMRTFFEGKTADEIAKFGNVLDHKERYPTGIYSRAQFIEELAQNKQAFIGNTPEEKAYYDHLTTQPDTTTDATPDAEPSDEGGEDNGVV